MFEVYWCCARVQGRGEKSIDKEGEDSKKRGGSEQGVAANAWGD